MNDKNLSLSVPYLAFSDIDDFREKIENIIFFDDFWLKGEGGNDINRINLNSGGIIGICFNGSAELLINNKVVSCKQGCLLVILPGSRLQILYTSPDFKGYLSCAHKSFFDYLNLDKFAQVYIRIEENPCADFSPKEQADVFESLRRLRTIFDGEHIYRNEIIRHLVIVLAYEISAIFIKHKIVYKTAQYEQVFSRFISLLSENVISHRDVAFYANALFITPRALTIAVQKASGITPAEWFVRTIIQKAKDLLTTSNLSIQEISYQLNFSTPTFFTRYFKQHVNHTPSEFRINFQK